MQLAQHLTDIHMSSIALFAVVFGILRVFLFRSHFRFARPLAELVEAVLLAIVLMFMIVMPFCIKSFYIPSGSMRPTLIDDDRILVNKAIYRVESPARRDCVVFIPPHRAIVCAGGNSTPSDEEEFYIKRLIGLPGDRVEIRAGEILIGPPGSQKIETHNDVRSKFQVHDRNMQFVRFTPSDVEIIENGSASVISKETLAIKFGLPGQPVQIVPGQVTINGKVQNEPYIAEDPDYDLKVFQGKTVRRDSDGLSINCKLCAASAIPPFSSIIGDPIPPREVMVLGDNRNYSNDSSHWGLLNSEDLVGRASLLFYPLYRWRLIR